MFTPPTEEAEDKKRTRASAVRSCRGSGLVDTFMVLSVFLPSSGLSNCLQQLGAYNLYALCHIIPTDYDRRTHDPGPIRMVHRLWILDPRGMSSTHGSAPLSQR